MDDKISVVLPIYNVEKYLNRCLKSVVNQTYKNIEIILVDDGSTDQCPELCEEWSRKDKRIKVIHKENAGLGMARNTGIENATGKYICFFDSDDFISLNAIETLYDVAVLSNADAVLFGFNKVDFKGNVYQSVVPKGEKPVYEGSEVRQIILPDLIAQMPSISTVKNLWMSAWACMYSLELIRKVNWRFVSEREIISEDVYSLLHLYNYIEKVAIVSKALYNYCDNATSLTHTYRPDRYEKIKIFYDKCQETAIQLSYGKAILDRISYPYMGNVIAALKMVTKSNMNIIKQFKIVRHIIQDEHLQRALGRIDLKEEGFRRKILFISMKRKLSVFCFLMIKVKKT